MKPPSPFSALPPAVLIRGDTSISFGENQLFPSLISLSLLPTTHPQSFQPLWVRASTKFYQRFTLVMGRSLGFGSACHDFRPIQTRFPCGFASRLNLATTRNSLAHYARGTRSLRRAPTVCRHMVSGAISLPSRGSFHLSLTVLVHYRSVRST